MFAKHGRRGLWCVWKEGREDVVRAVLSLQRFVTVKDEVIA